MMRLDVVNLGKSESMGSRQKKTREILTPAPRADGFDSSGNKNPSNCQVPVSPANIKLVSGEKLALLLFSPADVSAERSGSFIRRISPKVLEGSFETNSH